MSPREEGTIYGGPQSQDEQKGPEIDKVNLEKQEALYNRRIGEKRGRKLQAIWNYKLAQAQLAQFCVVIEAKALDVTEEHGTGNQSHDWISTGDPCWCGSDNCLICLVCLEENHD
jgi:hypothetical protein